jgi:hypothetical protein
MDSRAFDNAEAAAGKHISAPEHLRQPYSIETMACPVGSDH